MKILIIGGGGREHALAEAYAKSKRVSHVFVAPGNDFMEVTNPKIKCVPNVNQLDILGIINFSKKEKIDMVDVAQDEPLAMGVVDSLEKEGIRSFGPTQRAAEIEWNKAWSRSFMKKYNLPIPSFFEFNNQKDAVEFIKTRPEQIYYIKASGLASGKGAIRAENREQAFQAISSMKQFGAAGKTFLIEETMVGEEFSLFALCDGKDYVILGSAQDHKTAYTGDLGPNTGGMGAVSPAGILNSAHLKEVATKILNPFMEGMKKEGREYKGILFLGGMVTRLTSSHQKGGQAGQAKSIKIIEFNSRWGDPEAEVILSSIKSDYLELVESAILGKLKKALIKFDKKIRLSVAGCALGYPEDYTKVKNAEISGLKEIEKSLGIKVYGAGIKRINRKYVVNGGRVFHLVAEGENIKEVRKKAYAAMSQISIAGNNLFYRTDIGWREVERNK